MDEDNLPAEQPLSGEIVASRAEMAYQMRVQGMSLSDIANELHLGNTSSVNKIVNDRFKFEAEFMSGDEKQGILALEMARLDKLQSSIWQSAVYGDPKSVDLVLKIIAMRVKITGVDQPDAQLNQQTVLVIGGAEDNYVKKLKEISDDPTIPD